MAKIHEWLRSTGVIISIVISLGTVVFMYSNQMFRLEAVEVNIHKLDIRTKSVEDQIMDNKIDHVVIMQYMHSLSNMLNSLEKRIK